MSQQNSVPLIPRQVLFGNPDRASVKLSPDGTHIGFLAPVDGVLNVWVGPAGEPEAARPVTQDTYRGIRFYTWAYTNEHVLYIQDQAGDENWRLYSVDLGRNEIRDLTPLEGVQARLQEISPQFPDQILIGLNDRDPQLHDIYRLDISTGEMQLVQENPEFAGFVTDLDYRVRFAMRVTPDGGSEVLRPSAAGDWELFIRIAMEDMLTTQPIGFDRAGGTLYMIDSRDAHSCSEYCIRRGWTSTTLHVAKNDYSRLESKVLLHLLRDIIARGDIFIAVMHPGNPLGNDKYRVLLALGDSLVKFITNGIVIGWELRDHDRLCSPGDSGIQGNPSRFASHYFHDEGTFMRTGGITQSPKTLKSRINCRIEPDAELRAMHIVVNRSWNPDNFMPLLHKLHCATKSAVTADRYKAIKLPSMYVLKCALKPVLGLEIGRPAGADYRAATRENIADRPVAHLLDLAVHKTLVTAIYSERTLVGVYCITSSRAKCRIHSGGVPA